MFDNYSKSLSLSGYDVWGMLRGIGLFALAGLIVNIDGLREQLTVWGVSPFAAQMIIWAVVDLGRRFLRDYSA